MSRNIYISNIHKAFRERSSSLYSAYYDIPIKIYFSPLSLPPSLSLLTRSSDKDAPRHRMILEEANDLEVTKDLFRARSNQTCKILLLYSFSSPISTLFRLEPELTLFFSSS